MPACSVLFIENSVGLAGSTISLCDLVRHLDPTRFRPVVVLSRAQQHDYLNQHFSGRIPMAVVRPRASLRHARAARTLLALANAAGSSGRRLLLRALAALDICAVLLPYVTRLYLFARDKDIALIHHNNGFDVAAILLAGLLRVPLVAYQRGEEWNSGLVRALARRVSLYIANSQATRRSLLTLGVDPDRIAVIYPPIDLVKFDPSLPRPDRRPDFGVQPGTPCFGIVGSLVDWKGHPVFLKAAARVLATVPDSHAFIVGDVPDGDVTYRQHLLALARDLGIADRVIFTGFQHDIPSILQMLDVVVHASVRPEPFGRVIAEALAMRRPVVATAAGGPLEIIRHELSGLLVPPADEDALAAAIITLLRDRTLAARLADAGHREVRYRFSVTAHAERLQQVYAAVLADHGRGVFPRLESSATPTVDQGKAS